MLIHHCRSFSFLIAACALMLAGCGMEGARPTVGPPSSQPASGPVSTPAPALLPTLATTTATPFPSAAPATETRQAATPATAPATATLGSSGSCPMGIGLNKETASIVNRYAAGGGLVMTASPELALAHFPQLDGWFRVLGAPNLESLQQKGARAEEETLPYEALAYGLETGPGTPDGEWQDPAGSAAQAAAIAEQFGKRLVLGPGFRLMARNTDTYGPMARASDVWMLQTQQLQKNPPGVEYRREVEQIVTLIQTGNPAAEIWAQITLPPDREPDAGEWLAYRAEIADLVDGTYIGVYTWDQVDSERLLAVVDLIFRQVCPERASAPTE